MLDEPLQRDIYVVLLFAGDGIAADLSVLNAGQIQFFNELLLVERVG